MTSTDLVITTLRNLGTELELAGLAAPTPDLPLFGAGSVLDSLALVTLIADLEARLADLHGHPVILASESAMSRARSPFRTVATLAAYIDEQAAAAPAS